MNPIPVLAPFQSMNLSAFMPEGVSSAEIVVWVLYATFAFWAVYTLVAIYHWLKYSHASWLAFPAIAVHLFVSFVLISYGLSGSIPL